MSQTKYKKILIFGQTFNSFSGGGITLTNLFTGWPREHIAVLSFPFLISGASTDICDNYYQIGKEEHRWRFPFNLYKESYVSGKIEHSASTNNHKEKERGGIRHFLSRTVIDPVIKYFGIMHYMSHIVMSGRLNGWLKDFDPEIIYVQVSNREGINFARNLISHLKIHSVIHFMDDWPSTISNSGILKAYWEKKIDRELRWLLAETNLCLSISDAMTEEYQKRYGKKFIPFHNPIRTEAWLQHTKKEYKLNKKHITLLFSGRIGTGISSSLLEVAAAIDAINECGDIKISLHIQTTTRDYKILHRIGRYKCVTINPIAEYEKLPRIFSNADLLLICNDFTERAVKFLRLSIPTKTSEYMISGTPVIVYAPAAMAVSRFFSENDAGYCITKRNKPDIINGIRYVINNEEYRRTISGNAVGIAKERFASSKVSTMFQDLLGQVSA